MLPAAGARRSAYVPVAGAAARRAVWPRRRRLDPVELDRSRTGERIDVLLPPRPGRPRGFVRRTRASDKSPAQGVERRDHRGGTARDMKGVSGTRGRAMRIEDQGRSGAFRE